MMIAGAPLVISHQGTSRGSMAEFVLYHREMSTEVIADGFHHAPEMLQFAYRMKGSARLCLVSDCSRALDTPPGIYRIGHHETGEPFENDGAAPPSTWHGVQWSRKIGNTCSLKVYFDVIGLWASPNMHQSVASAVVSAATREA